MIKAFAVTLLFVMGSSVSEFSLSPEESFTLHFDHDYTFTITTCGTGCISLRVLQIIDGETTWTGQLFDIAEKRSYPLQMKFKDVVFDAVYVVSAGDVYTLRVSYREPAPVQGSERLVKATAEEETATKTAVIIIGELCAVILLIFWVAHKMLRTGKGKIHIPDPVMGFHDEQQPQWRSGIPRQEKDPDLELLSRMKQVEQLQEMEIRQKMRRRLDNEKDMGLDWI
jgi:hypothetical protein